MYNFTKTYPKKQQTQNQYSRKNPFKIDNFLNLNHYQSKARRTLELSAELSVTRGCWRKLFPQVCGVMFCDFCHACHELRIFNMLNNFVHE